MGVEMRVAVIDVGSNTIRLLVATVAAEGLRRVHERTARAGLGAEIELHGGMTTATIEAAAATVGRFADEARELGAGRVVVVAASRAGKPGTLGGLSSGSRRRRASPCTCSRVRRRLALPGTAHSPAAMRSKATPSSATSVAGRHRSRSERPTAAAVASFVRYRLAASDDSAPGRRSSVQEVSRCGARRGGPRARPIERAGVDASARGRRQRTRRRQDRREDSR